MAAHPSSKKGSGKRKPMKVLGIALLVVAIGLVAIWFKVARGGEEANVKVATFAAKKGTLTINVLESGTIKAREQEVIYNQVEGRTSIVWIVPEGTRVKEGDKLLELDTSTLRDQKIDQEIKVQNARAAWIDANEDLAVTENQGISDVNKAELDLQFAKLDLKKYNDPNGEYHNLLEDANNKITLAKEDLERAKETLQWSERLAQEKYLSKTELQADTLTKDRAEVSVLLAKNELTLLQEYTYNRQVAAYESDVYQKQMALERTQRKAKANVVQAEANLNAKNQEYEREKLKLAKIEDQLSKALVVSPTDAMVIYATSAQRGGGGPRFDNRQPLQEGVEVFERQELFYLPTALSSKAEVAIHESSLQKVRIGLPARITVDALPGKEFLGTLARIAPLPDPQSMWMNPDLKVYNSDVYLDEADPELRTGMNCKVDIIVARYDDAICVPVHTVIRVDGKPTVYVLKDDGTQEERPVEIGLDNNSMVRIISGLKEGEPVVLNPPLKSATVGSESQTGAADANAPMDRMTQRINQKLESAANGSSDNGLGTPSDEQTGSRRQGRGRRSGDPNAPRGFGGMRNMTPEQMQQMMQNMTPEQRQQMEAARQQFQNMTPEEREAMRQRFQQGGGRQGGGQGFGGDQGAGGQGQGGQGQGGQGRSGQGQGGDQAPSGGQRSRSGGGNP